MHYRDDYYYQYLISYDLISVLTLCGLAAGSYGLGYYETVTAPMTIAGKISLYFRVLAREILDR